MTMRRCLDCPSLIEKSARGGRCSACRRRYEKQRGTASARGYGVKHQATRKSWAPLVATGNVKCARCTLHIDPDAEWHLDHNDDRTGYLGPSHASCNTGHRPG